MAGLGTEVAAYDLVASCLTPAGRGAVAVIAVSGPVSLFDGVRPDDAPSQTENLAVPPERAVRLFSARNDRRATEQRVGSVLLGTWHSISSTMQFDASAGSAIKDLQVPELAEEEVVFTRISEDVTEIHCHGGPQAVRRILADLKSVGCEIISAELWEQREQGLLYTESRIVAADCVTARTAVFAMQQAAHLRAAIQQISQQSFPEAARSIEQMLGWWKWAEHLALPWQVVLIGRPNVGKSSLMNAILGRSRSIISPQPGTTRDVVTAMTSIEGWPMEFSDTAGLRETGDALETAGQEAARSKLARADLVLLLVDGSEPLRDEDRQLLRETRPATMVPDDERSRRRRILVVNKLDAVSDQTGFPSAEWSAFISDPGSENAMRISCLTHTGVDELLQQIATTLTPEVPLPAEPFPINARQACLLQEIRNACLKNDAITRDTLLYALQTGDDGAPNPPGAIAC